MPWDREPRQQDQLSGYLCFSRVQHIQDVVVVHTFSLALPTQSDLPGPNLRLALKRGEITEADPRTEWGKQDPKRKRGARTWPDDMQLVCRVCTISKGQEVRKPVYEFPNRGHPHL